MAAVTEIFDVHAAVQAALVPPVVYSGKLIEAYGRTVPVDAVGGDLADLVSHGDDVIAYVMDVSGHGLRAGVHMGMAKAAFRYGLLLNQPLRRLVGDINRVLGSIKEPNMYVTLAALRFASRNEAEYISAGHVPLLQFQQRTGRVVQHSLAQFPLGMFGEVEYVSRRMECDPGDIFALVTDGVLETGDDPDVCRGLERLASILEGLPGAALPDLLAAALAGGTGAGTQQDDATVLLVRCCNDAEAADDSRAEAHSVRIREETWRRLMDELAEELSSE